MDRLSGDDWGPSKWGQGDGAPGFLSALRDVWPETKEQRWWKTVCGPPTMGGSSWGGVLGDRGGWYNMPPRVSKNGTARGIRAEPRSDEATMFADPGGLAVFRLAAGFSRVRLNPGSRPEDLPVAG